MRNLSNILVSFCFSSKIISNVPFTSTFFDSSNFVSFSSSIPTHPPPNVSSEQNKISTVDPKSILFESTGTKLARLRAFANQLKQSIEAARDRTGNDENDHAIEHIYQVGNQQRLFIDYRPEDTLNHLNSHAAHSVSFLTQTFRGKLYIDEVYISTGQGTNKKLCKRHCFQQALDRFLIENFDVKLSFNQDGQERYELIKVNIYENQEEFGVEDDSSKEIFPIPLNHPMANTKMNFVHARDTSTIAGRTARQQSKLEQQYWQQWGQGMPYFPKSKRSQRSLSPPPPVPHQKVDENTTSVIEAISTTPASVAVRIY